MNKIYWLSLLLVGCSAKNEIIQNPKIVKNVYQEKKIIANEPIKTEVLNNRNAKFDSFLVRAVYRNNIAGALRAIAKGANVNLYKNEITLLHYSCKRNKMTMAVTLLEAGANPNYVAKDFSSSPLIAALKHKNIELVQSLLAYHANVNFFFTLKHRKNGRKIIEKYISPIYYSLILAKYNYLLTQTLLKANADVNAVTSEGNFPLKAAVFKRNLDLIKLLVKHGANVRQQITIPKSTYKLGLADYARYLSRKEKRKKELQKLKGIVEYFIGTTNDKNKSGGLMKN